MTKTLERSNGDSDYGHISPVAEAMAVDFGVKPGTAHQWMYGRDNLVQRTASVLRHFNALDPDSKHRWALPIIQELRAVRTQELDNVFVNTAQLADTREDEAEMLFRLRPGRQTAWKWYCRLSVWVEAALQLMAALRKQYQFGGQG